MNFIRKRIEKALNNNELVCICLNTINWNSRLIGYVKKIHLSDNLDFQIIDEYGQKKDLKPVLFSTIKSLEIGGTYNKNIDTLFKKEFLRNQTMPKYFSIKKQDLHKKLKELKETKALCTFFFDTEFSIGIVEQITEDEFSITNIAYDGTEDGISIFDIKMLTKIRTGSNFESRILFLLKIASSPRYS